MESIFSAPSSLYEETTNEDLNVEDESEGSHSPDENLIVSQASLLKCHLLKERSNRSTSLKGRPADVYTLMINNNNLGNMSDVYAENRYYIDIKKIGLY